jgi:hypothetical protein
MSTLELARPLGDIEVGHFPRSAKTPVYGNLQTLPTKRRVIVAGVVSQLKTSPAQYGPNRTEYTFVLVSSFGERVRVRTTAPDDKPLAYLTDGIPVNVDGWAMRGRPCSIYAMDLSESTGYSVGVLG